jgi:hypothetical protein
MEFRAKLDNDREYAQRFQPVLAYIDASLAKNPAGGLRRLTAIHNRFSRPAPSVGDGPRGRLPLPKEKTLAPAEETSLAPAHRGDGFSFPPVSEQ